MEGTWERDGETPDPRDANQRGDFYAVRSQDPATIRGKYEVVSSAIVRQESALRSPQVGSPLAAGEVVTESRTKHQLRKAQTQLSAHAGPSGGLTAWERFSAPLPPEKLIRQQLMVANGSRPGRFKYNGVATLGLELPSGPVSGYKAAREGPKDTSHDRAERLGRATGRSTTEAKLTGGWAAWDADSPPRTRVTSAAPPRTERRRSGSG